VDMYIHFPHMPSWLSAYVAEHSLQRGIGIYLTGTVFEIANTKYVYIYIYMCVCVCVKHLLICWIIKFISISRTADDKTVSKLRVIRKAYYY
jgi:hypothetical protein